MGLEGLSVICQRQAGSHTPALPQASRQVATTQPGYGRAEKRGDEGFSTRAAGGSVPLGLVAAALFLVLFVWGCRERKRSH